MKHLNGYIAAPFTPLDESGDLKLDLIPEYTLFLKRNQLDGVFVCGSTGESALLNREERMALAESWVEACGKDMKVVIHTGATNLVDQRKLAAHAELIGAWGIAAMVPDFFPPQRNEELKDLCKSIAAAAPSLPFYYYHIPPLNGISLSVLDLLRSVPGEIPNFAGVKFTSPNMFEFEQCRQLEGNFDMLWGLDEMFLDSLAFGNRSGVGGTFNHCFGIYRQMLEYYDQKDMAKCRELQHQSHQFCEILGKYRGNLMGGKRIMKFLGLDCGPTRLPLQNISDKEESELKTDLEKIGFFEYCNR